jgi:hypothetical protein
LKLKDLKTEMVGAWGFERQTGFAQKVEIDAARRILTVDTESQPAAAG